MRGPLKYLLTLVGLSIVVVALAPFQADINSTTVALAFLVVVLIVSSALGSGPGYFASVLAVLSLNFFFLAPLHTLTIADTQNWVALVAFLATAIIAGQLSSYARRRSEESETRREEIERLYRELKDAFEKASEAEALRRSEQLKSALLEAVTHDLRTPLTSIKASVTTLIEGLRSHRSGDDLLLAEEDQDGLLEIINDETDRLSEFIGGIVDLARVEAGKTDIRKTWIEVGGILDISIERCRTRLTDHIVWIEMEKELPAVRADADALAEIVYLFLDNAAKYSPPGSQIRLSAKRAANEMIEISVEDQGVGIQPELRERVFDKFYRASNSDIHTTGAGLGIGLAIAHGIAQSQGGNVWVEDGSAGFKTRFVFRFPVGDDENGAADQDG